MSAVERSEIYWNLCLSCYVHHPGMKPCRQEDEEAAKQWEAKITRREALRIARRSPFDRPWERELVKT